jgi:hypothetical protein
MKQFSFSRKPVVSFKEGCKDGVYPIVGLLLITGILVAIFALFIGTGHDMAPVVPPHMDDGEEVDSSPMRLAFMCLAFVSSFVFAYLACRKGKEGKVLPAFWLGYTGGTLLWQSMGECAWHFEGASAIFMVFLTTVLLIYCYRRKAFDWGIWVFVLSFVGNWFGHFVLIGTFPLVSSLMEEEVWFKGAGLVIGIVASLAALCLNYYSARTRKARLCCCLMLYFAIGIIVTGVSGI